VTGYPVELHVASRLDVVGSDGVHQEILCLKVGSPNMRHGRLKRSRWLIALSVLLVGSVVVLAFAAALAPTMLPAGDRMSWESRSVAAGVIFVGSYLALAIGRIPGRFIVKSCG
jgi:hypothetical protein